MVKCARLGYHQSEGYGNQWSCDMIVGGLYRSASFSETASASFAASPFYLLTMISQN